jgi:transposase-like protein
MDSKPINEEKIKRFQDELWDGIKIKINEYLKSTIELILEKELTEQLKAEHYERNAVRTNWRNGSYERDLSTMYGNIPDLSVARPRIGQLETEVFDRYARRQKDIDRAIGRLFLAGVSSRTLGRITGELTGKEVSAGTVANINKTLDEKVSVFQTRELTDSYVFLFLDGIVHKVKELGITGDKVCLCALGVKTDGTKELLSFQLVSGETEENWRKFVVDIKGRGLSGKMLKLITTDGNQGLLAALDDIYPFVKQQRCVVHKMRNVACRVRRRTNLKACLSGVSEIFSRSTKTAAVEKFNEWKKQWEVLEEKAVRCLEENLTECLNYFDFEPKLWSMIRTTNCLERAFREIRRRTDPMSSCTNGESAERVTFGLFNGMNEKWQGL